MQKDIIIFVVILTIAYTKSPPVFNYSYQTTFEETVIRNKIAYHTPGQLFYDPFKSRERVDWANG